MGIHVGPRDVLRRWLHSVGNECVQGGRDQHTQRTAATNWGYEEMVQEGSRLGIVE